MRVPAWIVILSGLALVALILIGGSRLFSRPTVIPSQITAGNVQSWCRAEDPGACDKRQFEESDKKYWVTYTRGGTGRAVIQIPAGFVAVIVRGSSEELVEGPVDFVYEQGTGRGEKTKFMRLGTYLILRYD